MRFVKDAKKLCAVLLAVMMWMQPMYHQAFGGMNTMPVAKAEEAMDEEMSLLEAFDMDAFSSEPTTWAQGACRLGRLLGYLDEDAADIDLSAFADRILGISDQDDGLYPAILAANGYFNSMSDQRIDSTSDMSALEYEQLLQSAFSHIVRSQEEADALPTKGISDLAVYGDALTLSALDAGRIALGQGSEFALSAVRADALTITGVGAVNMRNSEIQRAVINRNSTDDSMLHVDGDTKLAEIAILSGDEITVEGSGTLGRIRVLGDIGRLTVRASTSVTNETAEAVDVIGPEGETHTLQPGDQLDLELTNYIVRFITEGTPVEPQMVAPGEMIDYGGAVTRKEGEVFTAWYEDAEYTVLRSTLSPVEGELALYARFVDEANALTVSFETFGGAALQPLIFAPGETLLNKPVPQLYTSKEGYTFGGWCSDEECEIPFAYTDPIMNSMTLYAMYISEEQEVIEQLGSSNKLEDLDWNGEILLTADDDIALFDLPGLVRVEKGSGGDAPELNFREADGGFALYGAYYEQDGEVGFEPGATFVITLAEGLRFADFGESIDTLTVSIERDEVEIVKFYEDLEYILWENALFYQPVTPYDGPGGEGETMPGVVDLSGEYDFDVGEVIVLYDGSIDEDERSISKWESGAFDGYVLFAEVYGCEPNDAGVRVSFLYADPIDYIEDLDVHTTRDVDVEEILTDEAIARSADEITAQVMSNDELRAQLMVAVLSSQETQEKLDSMYGAGVYSLAGLSASVKMDRPSVSIQKGESSVKVSLGVSATVALTNDGETVLNIKAGLTFEEEVIIALSVDGGRYWIDMASTFTSITTIRLEVTANSGKDADASVLFEAKETLETLISPSGLDESIPYEESLDKLMNTMKSLIATELTYNDLYKQEVAKFSKSFYGIIEIEIKLELVAQIGVLATFGVEVIVTDTERIGFNYNFSSFKGESYTQKLGGDVRSNIYVIGKIGVRIGPRITLTITIVDNIEVAIAGSLYAYAELTGMFFYTVAVLTGESTNIGALHFGVGIDADINLELVVDLGLGKVKKDWTLWKHRWPLYSKSWSSVLTIMNTDRLDELWAKEVKNADSQRSFGFACIPMKSYKLINGSCTLNERLWASMQEGKASTTLTIENLVIDGTAISPNDPRYAVLAVGDGSANRSSGRVYLDEKIIAQYQCLQVDADIVLTYQDTSSAALVKKQSKTFHLTRNCEVSTTTVNVQFKLFDWCARSWGIESAPWDDALVYETQLQSSHMIGGAFAPSETAKVDLAEIERSARDAFADLEDIRLAFVRQTANGFTDTIQYSTPRVSNFRYLSPENESIRYDVYSQTEDYTITFNLYAYRFPGYTGEITYIVKLVDPNEMEYAFSIGDARGGSPMHFTRDEQAEYTWSLHTRRALFDGADRPLMMTQNGRVIDTGLRVNGRESEQTVVLTVNSGDCLLTVNAGEGVNGYEVLSPEISAENLVKPGEEVILAVEPAEGYRNIEMTSIPEGIPYERDDAQITFTMPMSDLSVLLTANPVYRVEYLFNYGAYAEYRIDYIAKDEPILAPDSPKIPGLTFRNWYLNPECEGEPYAFGAQLDGDITLYADWTCDVTVVFGNVRGQAAYEDEQGQRHMIFDGDYAEYSRFTYSQLRVGEKPYNISLPNYSGYEFFGWYLASNYSGGAVDLADYTLTGGITLYAEWAKILNVSYSWNYGELDAYFETIEYQNKPMVYIPEDPRREHYLFTGWYTRRECAPQTAFDTKTDRLLVDTTLYAGWTPVEYAIEYDLSGGRESNSNPTVYTIESSDIALYFPTREGYSFTGWTGSDLQGPTTDVLIRAGSHGPRRYTAVWQPIVYDITYELRYDMDDPQNPATYTVESGDILLNNPSRERLVFEGWSEGAQGEQTTSMTIPAGSTGDRLYVAHWSAADPDMDIARGALDAILSRYDYTLDQYRNGTGEDASLYIDARRAIDEDDLCVNYKDMIKLVLEEITVDPISNAADLTYEFRVTVEYTNPDGVITILSKHPVQAVVAKRVPTITADPVSGSLSRGQPLVASTLSGGYVEYSGEEVEGRFVWAESMRQITHPSSEDNGKRIYDAIFMPDVSDQYAQVPIKMAVKMAIGVEVRVTANDRPYDHIDEENASATLKSYTLWDVDKNDAIAVDTGLMTDQMLMTFADWNASLLPITVTATGYQLDPAVYASPDYELTNTQASTEAFIHQAEYSSVTRPITTKPYGTIITEQDLGDPKMWVGTGAAEREVVGNWAFTDLPEQTTPLMVGTYPISATFTPQNTNIKTHVSTNACIVIVSRAVSGPDLSSVSYVYNGKPQPYVHTADPDYEDTFYELYPDDTGDYTNVGEPTARFRLKDTSNYHWTGEGHDGTYYYATYQIKPAKLQAAKNSTQMTSISYGQLLAASDPAPGSDMLCTWSELRTGANTPKVTLPDGDTVITGDWAWAETDTVAKAVNDGAAHSVEAIFTPDATYDTRNFTDDVVKLSFDVAVTKVAPVLPFTFKSMDAYVIGVTSFPLSLYQPEADDGADINTLINPNNAVMEVTGKWAWESSGENVVTSGEYPYIFTPSVAHEGNYLSASETIDVTVTATTNMNMEYDSFTEDSYDDWNSRRDTITFDFQEEWINLLLFTYYAEWGFATTPRAFTGVTVSGDFLVVTKEADKIIEIEKVNYSHRRTFAYNETSDKYVETTDNEDDLCFSIDFGTTGGRIKFNTYPIGEVDVTIHFEESPYLSQPLSFGLFMMPVATLGDGASIIADEFWMDADDDATQGK